MGDSLLEVPRPKHQSSLLHHRSADSETRSFLSVCSALDFGLSVVHLVLPCRQIDGRGERDRNGDRPLPPAALRHSFLLCVPDWMSHNED